MAPTVYDKEIFAVVVASSLLSWWPCLHTIREILFTSYFVAKRTNTQTQTQTNKTLTQAAPPNLERLGSSDLGSIIGDLGTSYVTIIATTFDLHSKLL